MSTGKVRGAKRQLIVMEVQRISTERQQLQLTGDPAEDWLHLRGLLASSSADALKQVATDARYLRLLHRGSVLRTNLGALWRSQGGYQGAEEAVRSALMQEHFAAAQKDWRGIHLMTIHKSKGKEFDEVIIYDGMYQRIARAPHDPKCAFRGNWTAIPFETGHPVHGNVDSRSEATHGVDAVYS